MQNNMGKRTAIALIAAWVCLAGGPLHADVRKKVDELIHALGWDTLDLHVVEKDAADRPTLERDSNSANRVERKTGFHKNGKMDWQTVLVIAKDSDKTLYTGKKEWDEQGSLESVDIQDDAYNGDGKQMKGHLVKQRFENGLLTSEVKKQYFVATGSWGLTHKASVSYYADGTMKERVIEDPASDEKSRESWGVKRGMKGRKVTYTKWNSDKGIWQ